MATRKKEQAHKQLQPKQEMIAWLYVSPSSSIRTFAV